MLRNNKKKSTDHPSDSLRTGSPQTTGGKKIWFLFLPLAACCLLLYFHPFAFSDEQFVYESGGRRNPFIPLVTADGRLLRLDVEKGNSKLAVQGIIADKNGLSYALVNDKVIKIGDIIEGYQVLKIGENKILFIKDGQITEIILKKGEE